MIGHPQTGTLKRPPGISALAFINGLAFVLTLAFWLFVLMKRLVPWPGDLAFGPERANAATMYGFAIGDLIWSTSLLL